MAAHKKPREFSFPNAEAKLGSDYSCLTVIERDIPIGLPPKYLDNQKEFIELVLKLKLGRYDER